MCVKHTSQWHKFYIWGKIIAENLYQYFKLSALQHKQREKLSNDSFNINETCKISCTTEFDLSCLDRQSLCKQTSSEEIKSS